MHGPCEFPSLPRGGHEKALSPRQNLSTNLSNPSTSNSRHCHPILAQLIISCWHGLYIAKLTVKLDSHVFWPQRKS